MIAISSDEFVGKVSSSTIRPEVQVDNPNIKFLVNGARIRRSGRGSLGDQPAGTPTPGADPTPLRWASDRARRDGPDDPEEAATTHLFTIGHSNQSIDAFTAPLTAAAIITLADIRSIPGSNRNPQFHAEALARALAALGIDYVHLGDLGGRRNRQPQVDPDRNAGWHNASFRNYADYTTTPAFQDGLARLLALPGPVAYMCSEAVPWRCHRTIVSDNLVARGHRVTHLIGTSSKEHRLGAWGPEPVPGEASVAYPAPVDPQEVLPLDT